MNRDQVKELFEFLSNIYPAFRPTDTSEATKKVDVWYGTMKNMDHKRVMAKAQEHVQTNKFPPTIAEISAFAPEKNETLEKMKRWEEEAAQVRPEVKEEFRRKMQELARSKRG